jgi:hypothetical protein
MRACSEISPGAAPLTLDSMHKTVAADALWDPESEFGGPTEDWNYHCVRCCTQRLAFLRMPMCMDIGYELPAAGFTKEATDASMQCCWQAARRAPIRSAHSCGDMSGTRACATPACDKPGRGVWSVW